MTLLKPNNLTEINETLGRELELMAELKPLLRKKQSALVSNRLDKLQDIANQELTLSTRLSQLERQRERMVSEAARSLGSVETNLTLNDLLMFLPESDEKSSLIERSSEMRQAISDLNNINDDNKHLTNNLLNYTSMVVNLLTRGQMKPGYNKRGHVNDGQVSRALLDSKI